MHLALNATRADRSPAHEIREELPEGRVEEFGAGRQAKIGKVGKELARETQPLVDAIGTVQIRIVNKTLPPHDGPWLFEVHPHDDEDSIADSVRKRSQTLRVFDRGPGVVDRTGTDDGKKSWVAAFENGFNRTSRARYGFGATRCDRNLLGQDRRREQRVDSADPKVVRSHVNPRSVSTTPHYSARGTAAIFFPSSRLPDAVIRPRN